MRRYLMILVLLFPVSQHANAQTVTIGNGVTSTDSTDACGPYNQSLQPHHVQILYTADEIAAAGGVAGNITGLSFFCTGLPNTVIDNWTVKMAHTSLPNLNDTFASVAFVTVYGPTTYTLTTLGWNQLVFQTSFIWDGSSNVVIDIISGSTFQPVSLTGTNSYTYTDSFFCRYGAGPLSSDLAYTSHKRPNLQLIFPFLCSGAPTAGPITGPTEVFPYENFNMSVPNTGTGVTYQWQQSTDNIAWANSPLFQPFSQSVNTYYRVVATCTLSGLSDTSDVFEVDIASPVCNPYFTSSQQPSTYNVQFSTYTAGSGVNLWTVDSTDTVYGNNPLINFWSSGWHHVCLTYIDTVNGCTDAYCNDMYVSEPMANIWGSVYYDVNQNGVRDVGEAGIPYQTIAVGSDQAFSEYNGYYEVWSLPLGMYPVSYNVPSNLSSGWTQTSPNAYTVDATTQGSHGSYDFGVYIDSSYHNLSTEGWTYCATPGYNQSVQYAFNNLGVATENATVTVSYDSHMQYVTSYPTPTSVDSINHQVVFNLSVPVWWYVASVTVVLHCPDTLVLGTPINHSATVTIDGATDADPSDNTFSLQTQVSGSFDPNRKSVNPYGTGPLRCVNPNNVHTLTYTVEFQNTGTAPAHFIVVKDTLDNTKLDLTSLRLLHYTHDCHIDITSGNVLTAYFDNIMLPDSNSNEPASHGSFTFSIKMLNILPDFSQINNKAFIYFDYNVPVITNDCFVTLDQHLSNEALPIVTKLSLFPNPADNELRIEDKTVSDNGSYFISDITGRMVQTGIFSASKGINTVDIANGVYTLSLRTGDEMRTRRFVVLHP